MKLEGGTYWPRITILPMAVKRRQQNMLGEIELRKQ
jgi:hypothetical protein